MDAIKDFLNKFARPFLVKYLTRILLYGAAALSAKLAVDSPNNDTLAKVAEWGATAICAGAAMLIDYLHHRKDKAEQPK